MFSRYYNCPVTSAPLVLSFAITGAGAGRRLCLVSDSSKTSALTGQELARQLAIDGWQVTYLDLAPTGDASDPSEDSSYAYEWLSGQHRENYWYTPIRSLCAYHWLRQRDFDVVLFHHGFGAGYFTCVARDLGLAFEQTSIISIVEEPHALGLETQARFPTGRTDIERDCLERETVARSDALLTVNLETARWLTQSGWRMPEQVACIAQENEKAALSWGQWLSTRQGTALRSSPNETKPVFISVCLATYNRPKELRAAIASLKVQTYQHFELIVVDDGSTNPDVAALRAELEPLFAERKWRWQTQENAGPSKARNRVMEWGRGTHFLFMDDDNLALPDELACFARAAASGADILTCVSGWHQESDFDLPPVMYQPPRTASGHDPLPVSWIPVGAHLALALYTNPFGDTNALYRREVFTALGGFQGNREMVFEDFELLTRAVIGGYRLEVIPEVLFLYRRHNASRSMGRTIFTSHIESLRPIAALLPPSLRPLLLTLRAGFYEQHLAATEKGGKE